MEIRIYQQPDGNWRVEYPLDKPCTVLAALDGAIAAVKQQSAAAENASPVALANGDLTRKLLGR